MGATAGLFDFQRPLPGIAPAYQSEEHLWLVSAEDDEAVTMTPFAGQLRLGDGQLELQAVPPDPVQLAMLPEPPPWELPDSPAKERSSGSRPSGTHRSSVDSGQVSLF